jgi:RNA polymerase sigma-70 factor (ECF subfamily)
MMGRGDLAEDLLQETVARTLTQLPNLRDEAMFSSWLFGIARNVALEQLRRKVPGRSRIDFRGDGAEAISDPRLNPEMNAIKQQLYKAVRKGLAELDEDRRSVLALRILGNKRYDEIAEITGWSLAKVKIELYRARIDMRKALEPFIVK